MAAGIRKWPGVPLSERDVREGEVLTVRDRPEARYAWATGKAIGRFLEGLKAGKLLGTRCPGKCGRILFPPRTFCELDYVDVGEWVELGDKGAIETYSVSYLDTDARRIRDPIFVGVVSIEGASPRMGMMHYFGEVTKEEIHIGMQVRAVWKPEGERQGAVTDIKYFRPLRPGEG